ncbi:MAG: response regulator [Sulfurospirillaceae bacterium]|jgi:YesN/AraC family two-component response regulator|nr:response regulator [Sulfurospirillaceae bacterium]MCK9545143.1 response regulator [Sulfurospirillaceae bacterium]MDY0237858.1 response regulator [Campylobacterales bacterium]NLM99207.1 response regulator transcription factor [Campylobacteraceae bacterium]
MDLNSLKDFTLLYVEDEPIVREQTCLILKDFVKDVVVANDGEEGLKIAKEEEIDLIITDIMMPNLDGISMVKTLRKEHKIFTPVIIVTAFTETEYLLEAIRLQVEGFITKPINIKDLINTIYSTLLPRLQKKELEGCTHMINALSALIGGKKIEILKYIVDNKDKDNVFHGSYYEIMEALNVSKPTVVNMFKQMIKAGIIEKIKNKVYRFRQSELLGKVEK